MTAGTIYYDLQASVSDLQVPINLQLTAPDNAAVSMEYKPFQQFDRDYPDPTALGQGRPWLWSMFGTTLIIGPNTPDQAYTFRLPYLKEPVTVTAGSNTLNVPESFRELIVLGMVIRGLKSKNKYNQAQVVQQDFDILFEQMQNRSLQRQSGEALVMPTSRHVDDSA